MGKKRKLEKALRKRVARDQPTLAICVGKKCVAREISRAVAAAAMDRAHGGPVHVERLGCLHVCKKGPIVATYPRVKFEKRVDAARACVLVDKLAR